MKYSVAIFAICCALLLTFCGRSSRNEATSTSAPATSVAAGKSLDWSAITAQGVDEEKFLSDLDTQALSDIAANLQALVDEETKAEQENPELLLTEGWVRVFNTERYKQVIDMGEKAMKPLYWIIYKSPNAGMYEYICASALYELSGYDFKAGDSVLNWSTSKEFLEKFNEKIITENS